MTKPQTGSGSILVDMLVALALLGFVLLVVYGAFQPTFTLSHGISDRLSAQQDVRLALDRIARDVRESAVGRIRVYSSRLGCAGAYEGCVGFATARNNGCTGEFQLVDGAPNWQATLYLWRDTASNELRRRCDPVATFPATTWPPPELDPYTVLGRHVTLEQVALQQAGSTGSASIAIAVEEVVPAGRRRSSIVLFNETVFSPLNP